MSEHSTDEHAISLFTKTGHAAFSPSSAHRWMTCAGSLRANLLGVDTAGIEASYGSVAHDVTEEWLKTGSEPLWRVGTVMKVGEFEILIDEEMLSYVEESVTRCKLLPGDHLVEYKVDFSHLTPIPNQRGTLDFAAMRRGSAHVVDHKYGSSPENIVYAENNEQGLIYTIGLDRGFGLDYWFDKFIIGINQPILNHYDEWEISHAHLMQFAEHVRVRAAAAWQIDAPRTPGVKQCRFCRVRATCAANAMLQEELVSEAFNDGTPQSVEQMQNFIQRLDDDTRPYVLKGITTNDLTTAQLAKLIPFRSMAEKWWSALAEELDRRAHRGEAVPGMKLVEGRSHRHWINEQQAKDKLISLGAAPDDLVNTKVISPNQAETILGKIYRRKDLPKLLDGLWIRPPGKATLVPIADRRTDLEDPSDQAFDDAEF